MDVFYTSSGEPDEPVQISGSSVAVIDSPRTTAEPCPPEAALWRQWLERAGFAPGEVERLMFERLRPRDEGTTRQ